MLPRLMSRLKLQPSIQEEKTFSLPFELVQEIIQIALAPFKLSNYRERRDTLANYSLVSRLWNSVAQEESIKHLIISNLTAYKSIVERLEENLSLRTRVKLLIMYDIFDERTSNYRKSVKSIVTCCKDSVEEIWFIGFRLELIFFNDIDWSCKLVSFSLGS